MNNFKFLAPAPLVHSHDGYPIYAGDLFYTVAKHDFDVTYGDGTEKTIPKYNIAMRFVDKRDKDRFIPDHNRLWYFKSKSNAEWLIEHWKSDDGIAFHRNADILITMQR